MQQKSSRGVQQLDVDQAADALLAEQLRPTVERVRQKMGRGSPNTIAPMLETWFAGLSGRLGIPSLNGEEGEPAGAALARRMADQMWKLACEHAGEQANAALSSQREELARQTAALEAAAADLDRQRLELGQREAEARESLNVLQAEFALIAARGRDLEEQLTRARAEGDAVRKKVEEVTAEREADRRRFDDQAGSFQAERQRLHERSAAAERRMLEEVDRARQETKQARKEAAEASRVHAAAMNRLETSEEKASKDLAAARLEIAALRERLAASEKRAGEFQALLQSAALGAQKAAATPKSPRKRAPSPKSRRKNANP